MRNINELLKLMLKNKQLFNAGLCCWVVEMYRNKIITRDERILLLIYINNNKPKLKWYNPHRLFNNNYPAYYWILGCIKPRIKWLKKHIELTKTK